MYYQLKVDLRLALGQPWVNRGYTGGYTGGIQSNYEDWH
jgi:hypothetical protein